MATTPSEVFYLALARHQLVWNWTVHFAALCLFALTLLFHSYLLLAVSLACLGAGFFDMGLPEMKDGRWRRFVLGMIEWEKNWIAAPWIWLKWLRLICVTMVALLSIWALWTQNPPVLAVLGASGYLVHVVRDNKRRGVDP